MIQPQPLTRERREYIAEKLVSENCEDRHCDEYIEELLAAEQFWRETVKKSPEWCDCGSVESDDSECDQCGNYFYENKQQHKPDCIWLKAQAE